MNKVRLFALAASIGMFASTVSAAAVNSRPKDTSKSINTVVFSEVDEIIKAEFGGIVVPQSVKVSGYEEVRTTKTPANYSLLGGTCFEGFSNTKSKDNNLDGIVDSPIVSFGAHGISDSKTNGFWYHDSTKTFPTVKTFAYYAGQSEDGVGGRLIAPNSAAKNGFYMIDTVKDKDGNRVNYHTYYANNATGVDNAIKALIISGKVVEVYSNEKLIGYKFAETKTDANDDDIIESSSFIQVTINDVDPGSRTKIDDVKLAVLELLSGNAAYTKLLNQSAKKQTVNYHNYNGDTVEKYDSAYNILKESIKNGSADEVIGKGSVIVMDGNGLITDIFKDLDEVKNTEYSDYYSKNRITVLRQTSRYGIEELDSFTPVKLGNEAKYDLEYNMDTEGFTPVYDIASETNVALDTIAQINSFIKLGNGLYRVNTPANPTDKYVFMFDLGVKDYPTLDYVYASQSKGTIEYETPTGEELIVNGVKIGSKMFPTFSNVDEAVEFMGTMAGLGIVTDTTRLNDFVGKREWANGDHTTKYTPKNGLDAASAKQCTFGGEKKPVDIADIKVTTDADKINTSEHGIHTLTYTAKIGNEVVGSATQKVIIAPKYERKWQNGKVVELKAYHLNGKLYSRYDYNYAKNEVTVNYYQHDGQTIEKTVVNKIN